MRADPYCDICKQSYPDEHRCSKCLVYGCESCMTYCTHCHQWYHDIWDYSCKEDIIVHTEAKCPQCNGWIFGQWTKEEGWDGRIYEKSYAR